VGTDQKPLRGILNIVRLMVPVAWQAEYNDRKLKPPPLTVIESLQTRNERTVRSALAGQRSVENISSELSSAYRGRWRTSRQTIEI